MFVVNGFARGRRRKHLSHVDLWVDIWKAHDAIGPPVLFHKVWRSHATEAEIRAGLISPLEAHGNEVADKLAARGALRNALSMEYVAATRSTDCRARLVQTRLIEIHLMHVQNRTKTVRVKAGTSECLAKKDPAEAMSQLNRIGHDFSRVQVGKGRFIYKCRLCFLRGERTFLKQLLGKPCSAASHSVPAPDEPESFFIGDTPSSEDDPFGWGGDFDQNHQGYVEPCAAEQACESQGNAESDDGAVAAHDSTADTVFDPGTRSLERPQMPSVAVDVAVVVET